MIKMNRRALIGLVATLLILASVASCLYFCYHYDYVAESKEELSANIQSLEDSGEKYVTPYLRECGVPVFDLTKMYSFELYFATYYNYGEGMPDPYSHAKELMTLFADHYYDVIDRGDKNAVTDALLTCYVTALDDPYAVYRPNVETDDYFEDMSGKFGGIGILLEYNNQDQTVLINNVYENSPAEEAGIKRGDYIYAVDGYKVSEVGIENAVNRIRGQIGTSVEITVKRGDELITMSVMRAEVEEINVSYQIDEENMIGYVQVLYFKGNTFEQFKEAIDELEAAGVKGMILDLRGNPGGYVYSACDLVSYLVPDGQTVLSYQYKGQDRVYNKTGNDPDGDHVIDIPFVVLCDQYTASASEIVAAALRDYRTEGLVNCLFVGATTYGKGIMQNTFTYAFDGSSVTMTIASISSPSGESYHGIGVAPDVYVELGSEYDNQLEAAYEALFNLINDN